MKLVRILIVPIVFICLAFPSLSLAISADAFGAWGEGGLLNGQAFDIGAGGEVYEIDSFLHIKGQGLNGITSGTAAQLSLDPLQAGLDFMFSATLSDLDSDITLSYSFQNNTGSDITSLTFISFLDTQIDEQSNGFINETATTSGALVDGQGWEADEPDYLFGNIFANAQNGSPDNSNIFPPDDDVAMSLSFARHTLYAGQTLVWEIMLSEDGDTIAPGAFAFTHADMSTDTLITYSGSGPALVPEPNTGLLVALGLVGLTAANRRER
jgi:hypothetical protein